MLIHISIYTDGYIMHIMLDFLGSLKAEGSKEAPLNSEETVHFKNEGTDTPPL